MKKLAKIFTLIQLLVISQAYAGSHHGKIKTIEMVKKELWVFGIDGFQLDTKQKLSDSKSVQLPEELKHAMQKISKAPIKPSHETN
jgi:glycosidase